MNRYGLILLVVVAIVAGGCFRGVTSERKPDGSLAYYGEVLNTGDPLASPDVVGTFFDAAGNVIARGHADVCRPMPTGVASGFRLVLPPGTPNPARVEWSLQGERSAPGTDIGLAEVSGQAASEAHGESGETYVYGDITNESDREYGPGIACVAWLDANGGIVDLALASTADEKLLPGETSAFRAVGNPPADAVGTRLYLDALVPRSGTTGVIDFEDSAFRHERSFTGSTPTGRFGGEIGELHNDADVPLLMAMVGTVRDDDGRLIATSGAERACHVAAQPGGYTFGTYKLFVDAPQAPAADIEVFGFEIERIPLKAVNISRTSPSAGVERVRFTVTNTSGGALSLINSCVGVYNEDGELVGMLEQRLPGPDLAAVGPGETLPFSVDVSVNGTPARVVVIADGSPQ